MSDTTTVGALRPGDKFELLRSGEVFKFVRDDPLSGHHVLVEPLDKGSLANRLHHSCFVRTVDSDV